MNWIKCSDELPMPYEYVLVMAFREVNQEPSTISIARQYKGDWEMLSNESQSNAVACGDLTWYMDENEITHWMPLPPIPNLSKPVDIVYEPYITNDRWVENVAKTLKVEK